MIEEAEQRLLICEIGRRMYERNLVAATDGNISARMEQDRFLCTRSGVCKGDLGVEDILIVDVSGKILKGEGKVSSEFYTHLAAYEEREDINVVLHAHPPMATALTLAGISMLTPMLPDLVMALGGVPVAPYATPGSREGGDAIRGEIALCDTVLLDRHGAVTVGASLVEAWFKMEKLEHCAATLLAAYKAGRNFPPLDAAQIERAVNARKAYGVTWRCYPMGEEE